MALFKKRDDFDSRGIPTLPDFPVEQRELPSLPKNFNEDFNRNIIKSAIGEDFESSVGDDMEDGSIPSVPNEEKPLIPSIRVESSMISEPEVKKKEPSIMEGPESIFVRIDKFRSAKKELSDIKKGLLEVEAIINKIREIKSKEDNEVSEINLGLDNLKRKVGEIDSLVFDKV